MGNPDFGFTDRIANGIWFFIETYRNLFVRRPTYVESDLAWQRRKMQELVNDLEKQRCQSYSTSVY